MTLARSNPDWNLVVICITIGFMAALYAFLIYKGKL